MFMTDAVSILRISPEIIQKMYQLPKRSSPVDDELVKQTVETAFYPKKYEEVIKHIVQAREFVDYVYSRFGIPISKKNVYNIMGNIRHTRYPGCSCRIFLDSDIDEYFKNYKPKCQKQHSPEQDIAKALDAIEARLETIVARLDLFESRLSRLDTMFDKMDKIYQDLTTPHA